MEATNNSIDKSLRTMGRVKGGIAPKPRVRERIGYPSERKQQLCDIALGDSDAAECAASDFFREFGVSVDTQNY